MTIPIVLSQHAEEAAFHWLLRDLAVWAPHYDLKDLTDLDGRVEGHVDGLRIGGDAAWEVVLEELGREEPGEVFVAMLLALEAGSEERLDEVLEVATTIPELARGAISAIGWLPRDEARRWTTRLLESDDPMRRLIGLGGAAVQRDDPGDALNAAILGGHEGLRARALKAAGELGRTDLLPRCRAEYGADDDETRFQAARSAALLGDAEAIHPLAEVALSGGRRSERAIDVAARRMSRERAHAWASKLAEDTGTRRLAARIARATADPVLVPWLLELMADPNVARPAGEAFSFMTGLDLAYEDLEGDWPEGFEAGPTEDPSDEDVALDADEDLPWPAPELLAAWWARNGSGFQSGTRYMLGQPFSSQAFVEALRSGRQRVRGAAALELALADPARPLFETRAPGKRQRGLLDRD